MLTNNNIKMKPLTIGKLTITKKPNQRGAVKYHVNGTLGDRRVQKQLVNLPLASSFCHNENKAREKLGDHFLTLKNESRINLAALHLRARKEGYSLNEAVNFFEKYRTHIEENEGLQIAEPQKLDEQTSSDAPTVCALVNEFNDMKKEIGSSKDSLRAYRNQFEHLKTDLGQVHCDQVSKEQLIAFMGRWAQNEKQTYNSNLTRLKTLFKYALAQEYIETNHADKIAKKMTTAKDPHILGIETTKALLKSVMEHAPEAIWYYALALFAGIRPEEIDRLDPTAINLKEGYVEITLSKTGKRRLIMLKNCGPLKEWLKLDGVLPTNGILKTGTYAIKKEGYSSLFQKIYKKAGIKKWVNDCLRHTFCSMHKEAFENPEMTNKIAGHGEDVSKEHYENVVTDDRKLVTYKYAQKFWQITPINIGVQMVDKKIVVSGC